MAKKKLLRRRGAGLEGPVYLRRTATHGHKDAAKGTKAACG